MSDKKRVLTVVLGLFLSFFPVAADGEETETQAADTFLVPSFSTGTIWVEAGKAAGYWNQNVFFKTIHDKVEFYAEININHVKSNLDQAQGFLLTYSGKAGFDSPLAGFNVESGFFQHSPLYANFEKAVLYNNGGSGSFWNFSLPLHFGRLNIEPSFFYGKAGWEDGSLYWFFGKPDISGLGVYGLNVRYAQHAAGFHYFFMDADIVSDTGEPLFDSHFNAWTAHYQFSLERKNFRLAGTLGWLYAGAELEGALTASNQHYALFPFNFFNINGSLGLHTGFAAFSLKYRRAIFQYGIDLGAAHIFSGAGAADVHSKMKRLFGGEETFETVSLETGGTGAAFMRLDAGAVELRTGKKVRLSLGLRKLFLIPWGYKQFLPNEGAAADASAPSPDEISKWVVTVLFSGFSLYGSLFF